MLSDEEDVDDDDYPPLAAASAARRAAAAVPASVQPPLYANEPESESLRRRARYEMPPQHGAVPDEPSLDGSCWQRSAGAADDGPDGPPAHGEMPWLSALPDGGHGYAYDEPRGSDDERSPPAPPRAAAEYHDERGYAGDGGHAHDDGYDDRGAYDDQRGAYADQRDAYDDERGAYDDQRDAYDERHRDDGRGRRGRYADGDDRIFDEPPPRAGDDGRDGDGEPEHERDLRPSPPAMRQGGAELAPPRRARGLAAQARAMRADLEPR
jgi:hypothetical protein